MEVFVSNCYWNNITAMETKTHAILVALIVNIHVLFSVCCIHLKFPAFFTVFAALKITGYHWEREFTSL